MSNPKKNFIYNLIYQILIFIIPFVTMPYISRVLGAEGVGIYSYTHSIVYYFMILTLLGINNYGNRSIAKVRKDSDALSNTFWEIYIIQLFSGIIMLLLYIIYVFFVVNEYKKIFFIQSLFIVSAICDINWFFFGLEKFKKTIFKNTFVKIGNMILIFVFINEYKDIGIYSFIMAFMTFLGQIILWIDLKKEIKFVWIKFANVKRHIKSIVFLFIPVIAVSIYKMMDKIMLGTLLDMNEVGYYENAEKLINIPQSVITALGVVMLPRISNMIANGLEDKVKEYLEKSIKFILFLSFPMCLGLMAVGKKFAVIYFGNEFAKTGDLIVILSIIIPIIAFANVIRTQYLIPKEKDKIYIVSVIIGALINFSINFLLIPRFKSIGACIGTIFAEASVMLYQTMKVKNFLDIKKYFKDGLIFAYKSIIMFIIIIGFNKYYNYNIITCFIQVIIGVLIYILINLNYVNDIVDFKKILKKIRGC